jgi:hypothetical protein
MSVVQSQSQETKQPQTASIPDRVVTSTTSTAQILHNLSVRSTEAENNEIEILSKPPKFNPFSLLGLRANQF